jgi:UDP-N-acetylglucosamine transferase subunit ALG13
MPRKASLAEHVDDHQIEFAQELEQSGKIVIVREEGELPDAILYVLSQTNKTVSQPIESEMVRLVSQALSRLNNNK